MTAKFHIGDRVICIDNREIFNKSIMVGDTGVVCEILMPSGVCGVDWGFHVDGGHSCSGSCPDGHGWRVEAQYIKLAEPERTFNVSPSDIESLFLEVI